MMEIVARVVTRGYDNSKQITSCFFMYLSRITMRATSYILHPTSLSMSNNIIS